MRQGLLQPAAAPVWARPEEDSIGVVFGRITTHSCEWYIIKDGKAKYISEASWFELYNEHKTVNQPLYVED